MMSNSFLYEEPFVEQEKARGNIHMWTQEKQENPTLKCKILIYLLGKQYYS